MTPPLPFPTSYRSPEVERPDRDSDSGGLAEDTVPFHGLIVPARSGAGLKQVKQNRLGWSHPSLPSEPIVSIDPRCLQEHRTLIHDQRRIDWVRRIDGSSASSGPAQINELPVIHVCCLLSLRFVTLSFLWQCKIIDYTIFIDIS